MTTHAMKSYSSFLIRLWLIDDESAAGRSVINVEHIQSGDHMRVRTLAEAEAWMFAACHNRKVEELRLTRKADSPDE